MRASHLAKLCEKSYEDANFKTEGVDVLYSETDTHHVYAIAGTSLEWRDITRNLSFWRQTVGNTDAHAGYAKGWAAVEAFIITHYEQSGTASGEHDGKRIMLTGHSMGGAIAVIGAYTMMLRFAEVDCVTFGAPPSIDIDALDDAELMLLESVVIQYEHVRDPIPSAFRRTGLDRLNRSNIGGLFRRPFWMRRFRYHAIELYDDVMSQLDNKI